MANHIALDFDQFLKSKSSLAEEPGTTEPPAATSPRFLVLINDEVWPEITNIQIEQMGYTTNSAFTLDGIYTLAGKANSIGTLTPGSRLARLINLTEQTKLNKRQTVEIYGGYSNKDQPSVADDGIKFLFGGVIDRIFIDVGRNIFTIRGTDYTKVFLESFTHSQFRNTTTAAVVREIADHFGFDTVIADSGSTLGTVYDYESIDFTNISTQGFNNWELLTKFADFDQYKVFTIGKTLYYVPYEYFTNIISFTLGKNIDALEMERNYSITQSRVSIEIASTRLKEKDSILVTAGIPAKQSGAKGDLVQYRFYADPSTPPDVLGDVAEGLALALAQLEYIITIHTTGAPNQNMLSQIILHNTGTEFDTHIYRVIRSRWDFGYESGWRAQMTGIALPPQAILRTHRFRTRRQLGKIE